jgi:hypothetical protein
VKYPPLNEWHKKLEQLPGFDENLNNSKVNASYLRKMIDDPIFGFCLRRFLLNNGDKKPTTYQHLCLYS